MKTILIVQAKYNSTRLSGEILLKYKKEAMLSILVSRLKSSKKIEKIIVDVGKDKNYSKVIKECDRIGVEKIQCS